MKTATVDDSDTATPPRRLPRVMDAPAQADVPQAAKLDSPEHNPMFDLMVESETDVVGLLAYGLYKQNKRDWLIAFQARENRQPTGDELQAFILGERIPRRAATYRRLAEDMLAADMIAKGGNRPGLLTGLMAQPANDASRTQTTMVDAARKPITWRYIGFLLVMLVVMAVLFRLAASWLFGTGR